LELQVFEKAWDLFASPPNLFVWSFSSTRYSADFTYPCSFSPDNETAGLWNLQSSAGTTAKGASANALEGHIFGATWGAV